MIISHRHGLIAVLTILAALSVTACSGENVGTEERVSGTSALKKHEETRDGKNDSKTKSGGEALVCSGNGAGGPTSCEPGAVWKRHALEVCEKQGVPLEDFNLSDACGKDGFRNVKFRCCSTEAAPPPPNKEELAPPKEPSIKEEPKEPLPGDPNESCAYRGTGLEKCVPPEVLREIAKADCARDGLELTAFNVSPPCATGGSSASKYSCCK
jgi:hypothetical protein